MITWLDVANFGVAILALAAGTTTAIVAIRLARTANKIATDQANAAADRAGVEARLTFGTDVVEWYRMGMSHSVDADGSLIADGAWRATEHTLRLRAKHLDAGASSVLDLVTSVRESAARMPDPYARGVILAIGSQHLGYLVSDWISNPSGAATRLDAANRTVPPGSTGPEL